MHWKLKAKIQNAVSHLPNNASYNFYYWIQRHFGGLRRFNPSSGLRTGLETWKRIQKQDLNPNGKVFFEVGTGRVPLVPLAYWLMGAESTITIDLNPYLKPELIAESLHYIYQNEGEIQYSFNSLIDRKRFSDLLNFTRKSAFTATDFLDLCQIEYIAPGDAADTRLQDNSIDFHTSNHVFEHIPINVLKKILKEGARILKENGLFIHKIDYSDHFSHSDKNISAINFLQFTDVEWQKYAGNRYMYMNRLRHDDFIDIFSSLGNHILESQPNKDKSLVEFLRSGELRLDHRFRSKPEEILTITGSWIIAQKNS
jgi:SAM-dependent methyltransferase